MIAVARLAILVGIAGLVPFILAIIFLLAMKQDSALILQYFYLYSAGILAFMAGIYWPLAMQLDNRSYPLSPLVTMLLSQLFFVSAGLGLLLPAAGQVILYTLAYIGLYIVDAGWMRVYWPAWYLRMRLGLTSAVVVCQVTAGFVFFYG
jgi:Kef-type K+ transport system membrane component KefB